VLLNENNTVPSSTREVEHGEAHSVQTEQNRTMPAKQQAQALTRLRQEGAETTHNTNTENSLQVDYTYCLHFTRKSLLGKNRKIYFRIQATRDPDKVRTVYIK
jgi:hypothetical protein